MPHDVNLSDNLYTWSYSFPFIWWRIISFVEQYFGFNPEKVYDRYKLILFLIVQKLLYKNFLHEFDKSLLKLCIYYAMRAVSECTQWKWISDPRWIRYEACCIYNPLVFIVFTIFNSFVSNGNQGLISQCVHWMLINIIPFLIKELIIRNNFIWKSIWKTTMGLLAYHIWVLLVVSSCPYKLTV